jgi:hypothetical protein
MARPEPAAQVVLIYRVPKRKRAGLLRFFREAFPEYEAPGGIHMSLFESVQEVGLFVEVAAYDTDKAFRLDQVRVEKDPKMRQLLGRWQKFIEGRPEVHLVRNVPVIGKVRPGSRQKRRTARSSRAQ